MLVQLININIPETMVAKIQRISYGRSVNDENKETEEKEDIELLKRLWRWGHLSVFEFLNFIFYIECPIFIQRQLFRYRTSSFMEQSLRRQKQQRLNGEQMSFLWKNVDENEEIKNLKFEVEKQINNVFDVYEKLIQHNIPKERQRQILPLQVNTKFYWRIDQRNLFHVLEERISPKQQKEMRELQAKILNCINTPQTKTIYSLYLESLKEKHVLELETETEKQ